MKYIDWLLYVWYIFDRNTRDGLLLCRGKNRVTVDWSLKSTNVPIGISTYELKEQLPKELIDKVIELKIVSEHMWYLKGEI